MTTNEEVLDELPNDAVRAALLEIIENNVPTKDYTLDIAQGAAKGDNYIGVVHRLSIIYEDQFEEENPTAQKLGIFIKVPPINLARREQFLAKPCFQRESLVYDEFLPLVTEFQKSKGIVPEENGFREFAKCYKNLTNEFEEAIFMEDLCSHGFIMNSRFEDPTPEVVKVIMRALGKLHALSFALKDQCPERFAKYRELEEIFRRDDDKFINYINGLCDIAYETLSDERDAEYLKHFTAFVEQRPLYYRMNELVEGSRAEPYAVFCHGDCWTNNILFKYENDVPVDTKFLDWQMARFASPASDLMYYIFGCTSKSLRDKYYEDFLDAYYSALTLFLEKLGSDPKVLFPRAALDDQLKKFGSFGLIMGLMLIPTITTKEEDVPDLDYLSAKVEEGDEEYLKQAMQNKVPATNIRIRDVIIDSIKLGFI